MRRNRWLPLAALSAAAAIVVSCDDPTRPAVEGDIRPRIVLVQADAVTRAQLILPLDTVFVKVSNPALNVNRTVGLRLQGGFWQGTVTNLKPGDYQVSVEGVAGGQIQYFGYNGTVTVVRGDVNEPQVFFEAAVPNVSNPPLNNTTNFSQRVRLAYLRAATNYVVQVSQDPTFAGGGTEFPTASGTDTLPLVTVTQPGTWYVRSRANLPNVPAGSIPFSDARSWIVVEASGGDNATEAQTVTLTPESPQTVGDRNLTPTKREDWYDIAVEAGDSLFVETFAARLQSPQFPSLLNTTLTLFESNGTTQVAQNLDAPGTTDSRLVYVAASTQTYKLRVGATGSASGHYELVSEIRRLPLAPNGLDATIVSGTEVTLTWNDNSNNETSFRVERCEAAGCTNFVEVATPAPNVETLAQTGLTAGATYRWRVRARNNVGNSAYTGEAVAALVGPAAPTNLVGVTLSNTSIQLTWTDVATNETGYEIQRCTVSGGCVYAPLTTVAANSVSYTDGTVAYNTAYQYQIRATNNVVPSAFTAGVAVNTMPPATPSGLTATVAGPTTINLSWTDNSADETHFLIERCLGDGCSNFAQIDSVAAGVTNYASTVAVNSAYSFRVRARSAVISQTYTAVASADTRPPTAPTALGATTQGPTAIALAWTDNSDDETGFRIERCATAGCSNFTLLTTVAAGSTAYTDNGVTVDNSYVYRVIAVGVPGNSAPTNDAPANTLRPAAPSGLAATTISANVVRLNWVDNANNETGYQLLRCGTGGCTPSTVVATFASGVTTFDDSTTIAGVAYTYALRATNVAGQSAASNQASASTEAPAAPSSVLSAVLSGTSVALTWTNNAPSATGTRVERCSGISCSDFAEIAFVPAPGSGYVDNSVTQGNVYSYRLRAQNAADVSVYTASIEANTSLPSSPGTLTARPESPTAVLLEWSASPGPNVAGYLIARCDFAGCTTFAPVDSVGAGVTQYIESGLATDTDYRYTVRAINTVGQSAELPVDIALRVPTAPTLDLLEVGVGYVDVTFSQNSANADSLEIERSCLSVGCSYEKVIALLPNAVMPYRDFGVTANEGYLYRVRAINAVGISAYSGEIGVNTLLAVPPTATAALTLSATSIQVTWTDASNNETGFSIERCAGDSCSAFAAIGTAAANADVFIDAGVAAEESYTYRVRAVAAFGVSAPSPEATTTTRVPAAPTALVATTQSNTAIQISWADQSSNEAAFVIERCAGAACTNFVQVGLAAADAVVFNDTGLDPSTIYRYTVRAQNAAGSSAVSNIAEATTNLPAIPTGLTYTEVGTTGVTLEWTDNAADELDQRIERCTGVGCDTFAELVTLGANVVSYVDNGLVDGETYRYRVRARNGAGSSDFSTVLTVTTGAPPAPVGASATTVSGTRIDLGWTDASNNETGFTIERCAGDGCAVFSPLAIAGLNATSYVDLSVVQGEYYTYRILATNDVGASAPAGPVSANTFLPNAPTNVAANTVSSTRIDVTWTDGGPFETGYQIERCTGAACTDFALIATTAANATSFQNTGLTPNETYRYQVRAVNAVGTSAYSPIVSSATDVPADPADLAALTFSAARIDLSWTDNASNETEYQVERCSGVLCGVFTPLALLPANTTSYSDETVVADESYSYRVRAFNVNGFSNYSNVTTTNTSAPGAPVDLVATLATDSRIELAWSDKADNELSFEVERCAGAGCTSFTLLATLPANTTSYADEALVGNETFRYQVRAVNNVAVSAYTNEAEANTLRPASPSVFTATTVSATRVDLAWNENATNEIGYRILRCSGDACTDFALLQEIPANSDSYSDLSAVAGQVYGYRVFAYNVAGQSDVIADVYATTAVPEVPTGLTAVAASANQMDLTWTDASNIEDGYRIEQCVGVGCEFVEVGSTGPNATGFSATGLSINTVYSFRVRAFNAAGTSAYTAAVVGNTFGPNAPSALSTTTVLSNQINLSWTDNATNELGFRIERCLGAACADFTEVGVAPANTPSFQDTGVSTGNTYRYRVRSYNGVANSGYSAIATGNTNVPAAPSLLGAAPQGETQIDIAWQDNATGETGYEVERCTGVGCSDFTLLTSLAANSTAYSDASVVTGTFYSYRVRALGNGASDYSNVASANTVLPNAPSDIAATAISDTQVEVTWIDGSDNETSFELERCEGAGCNSFTPLAMVGPNVTTYTDGGLTPGSAYRYRVRAANGAGSSAPSEMAVDVETTVPSLPTGLTGVVNAGQIDLSWTDNATTELGYRIERCEGAGCTNFTQLAEVATPDLNSYADASAVDGTTYRYRVRSYNASGASGASNAVTLTAGAPSAPSAFTATTILDSRIDLAWTDNSNNETGFEILRCEGVSCTPSTVHATVGADVTLFEDTGLNTPSVYSYQVRAINAAGASAASAVATARTSVPATPDGLAAVSVSATQVNLTWNDQSDDELGFRVERCIDASCTFAQVVELPPNTESYSDMSLSEGETYRFRVYAFNAAGASGYTLEVVATTDFPLPPSGLTAATVTATQIDLSWADNASNETGYEVERCEGVGCGVFSPLASIGANSTGYSDLSVTVGNSYTYRVRATRPAANSAFSDVASANTNLPAIPTLTSAVATTLTSVTLDWDNEPGTNGVRIERCTIFSCVYAEVAVVDEPTSGYVDTGLSTGETYSYRIRRYNNAGSSDPSNSIQVALLAPAVPTDVSTLALSPNSARVTWTDASTDETGFRIERCDGVGCVVYGLVGTVGAGVTTFDNGGLTPGISYTYRVRSQNVIGQSAPSAIAGPSTVVMIAPLSPDGLTATTTSGNSIQLNWNDVSPNETGFSIERCTGAGCGGVSFTPIAAVGANVTTFNNNLGVSLNETYTYRVRAFNNVGPSGYTFPATANTLVPLTPSGLATQTLSGTSVRLTWLDNATTETGYRIFRCVLGDCSDAVQVAELGANTTLYDDTGLTFGTVYSYAVRSFNIAGQSPISNISLGSTVLAAPTNLRAATFGATQVRLTWTDNAVFESGYEVQACEGGGCSGFAAILTTAANATQVTVGGLNEASNYSFQIRALSPDGVSGFNGPAGARTPIPIAGDAVVAGIADTASGERHYRFTVPPGTPRLRVLLESGGNNPELYVRRGLSPVYSNVGFFSDTLCVSLTPSTSQACTITNPAPGDWYVMIQGNGAAYSGARMSVVLGHTDFVLYPCGAAGPFGPSQAQCDAFYTGQSPAGLVTVNNGIQSMTLPHSGRWRLLARGAQGASGAFATYVGGRGAQVYGELNLTAGTVLHMVVGQMGVGQGSGHNGGGGGGSFIVNSLGEPLMIGGGGGGTRVGALQNGCDASFTGFGIVGSGDFETSPCTVKIVNLGLGGLISSPNWYGSGGAGFYGDGQDDVSFGTTYGLGGKSWANGMIGGLGNLFCGAGTDQPGGFGGGGAGNGCRGGGGGGGYSGGDGGWIAGGGGSLNTGFNQGPTVHTTGNGIILLQYLGPSNP